MHDSEFAVGTKDNENLAALLVAHPLNHVLNGSEFTSHVWRTSNCSATGFAGGSDARDLLFSSPKHKGEDQQQQDQRGDGRVGQITLVNEPKNRNGDAHDRRRNEEQ